jgi:hypothetical protein
VHLGAQLPMLVLGFYSEAWHMAGASRMSSGVHSLVGYRPTTFGSRLI